MRVRILAAVAGAAALAACGGGGGGQEAAAPEKNPAEQAKLVATLPAPYNTGDPAKGKKQFGQCQSCHSLAKDGPNLTGPHLYGVMGRAAGTVAGYRYSDALKTAGGSWTAERLDHWLANPRTALPGTKMSFAGIPDAKDRIDLIAYLRTQADS